MKLEFQVKLRSTGGKPQSSKSAVAYSLAPGLINPLKGQGTASMEVLLKRKKELQSCLNVHVKNGQQSCPQTLCSGSSCISEQGGGCHSQPRSSTLGNRSLPSGSSEEVHQFLARRSSRWVLPIPPPPSMLTLRASLISLPISVIDYSP